MSGHGFNERSQSQNCQLTNQTNMPHLAPFVIPHFCAADLGLLVLCLHPPSTMKSGPSPVAQTWVTPFASAVAGCPRSSWWVLKSAEPRASRNSCLSSSDSLPASVTSAMVKTPIHSAGRNIIFLTRKTASCEASPSTRRASLMIAMLTSWMPRQTTWRSRRPQALWRACMAPSGYARRHSFSSFATRYSGRRVPSITLDPGERVSETGPTVTWTTRHTSYGATASMAAIWKGGLARWALQSSFRRSTTLPVPT